MPIPFGQALRLWRLHRGLTQQQLAAAAGVPRPNLCAIERGRRELSLTTLRALALALDASPGLLVDGVPPSAREGASELSRTALERIAEAVVSNRPPPNPEERALAALLRDITTQRAALAAPSRRRSRKGHRVGERAWLTLEAAYPPHVIRSLLERIGHRQRVHEPPTD